MILLLRGWRRLHVYCFCGYIGNQFFPKPLTAAEEREHLEKMARGSRESRNILIEKNLRLVAHICKKYEQCAIDKDDLISIGIIGLIKAIDSFSADRNVRLATYASRCIENAILSQRNNRRLRWKTMNLLGQNGLCSAAWKSAAMYWLRMLQVH